MFSTTDEEMAVPVQQQQERGDELASVSVASLSTQHIGDIDVSTGDRTAAADAAAATARSPTSRRINVLAFCGTAALLALAMGVAVATMGDTGPDEGAYHDVGVSAAERQPMNVAPSAGSPLEDTAAAGLPGLIADPVVAVASDVSEAPIATPTATTSATPSAMPTAAPTAAPTSTPTTAAPMTAPMEAGDGDFWGFGRSSGDSSENDGGFGQDDFWGFGPADSSSGSDDGDRGDDFFGLNLLESSSSGDGDGADDFFGFNLLESSSSGDGDGVDDFFGFNLLESSSSGDGDGADDFFGFNLLESSSSGDGDGADDFFGFNLLESSSSSGDVPDDADEDGCFDDVVCCVTFGLFC